MRKTPPSPSLSNVHYTISRPILHRGDAMTDAVIASSVLFCFLPLTKQRNLCVCHRAQTSRLLKHVWIGNAEVVADLTLVLFKDVIVTITKCFVLIQQNHVGICNISIVPVVKCYRLL